MIRKLIVAAIVLALIGLAAFWLLTMPRTIAMGDLPPHTADLKNGEEMFWAGGCESCHAAPGAKGDDLLKLGGGLVLASPFGKFHVPNISPDPDHGIGGWNLAEFVTAMKLGIGKGGTHLYPAFPYTSYQHMKIEDIIDLKAFLDTLPKVADVSQPHELPFPFSIRRGLGLWQLLYVNGKTTDPNPAVGEKINRGAYLVEGPGHCQECHTPRGLDGGMIAARAFSGAPNPTGKGRVPNITQHADGLGDWTESDILDLVQTGMMVTGDVVGGPMVAVQANLARLPLADQQAIAAYIKTIPAIPNKR